VAIGVNALRPVLFLEQCHVVEYQENQVVSYQVLSRRAHVDRIEVFESLFGLIQELCLVLELLGNGVDISKEIALNALYRIAVWPGRLPLSPPSRRT